MTCVNCGMEKHIHARGLCRACYAYQLAHGVSRPSHYWTDRYRAFCKTCGERKVHAKGECITCYNYRLDNGKRRPPHLWRTHCKICGAPRVKDRWSKGRCELCAVYLRRHGAERPSHMWKCYCDCGNVATHLGVEVSMLTTDKELPKVEKYDLCEDCYQLEMEE